MNENQTRGNLQHSKQMVLLVEIGQHFNWPITSQELFSGKFSLKLLVSAPAAFRERLLCLSNSRHVYTITDICQDVSLRLERCHPTLKFREFLELFFVDQRRNNCIVTRNSLFGKRTANAVDLRLNQANSIITPL